MAKQAYLATSCCLSLCHRLDARSKAKQQAWCTVLFVSCNGQCVGLTSAEDNAAMSLSCEGQGEDQPQLGLDMTNALRAGSSSPVLSNKHADGDSGSEAVSSGPGVITSATSVAPKVT